uniref:Ras-GEF domain-containing protein n=1 Tax=Timema bartmani TaxID=61472 RepID=A0A7R9I202_9NEOP|nr:unnamed protein product [Timema bartmani]
MPPDETDSKPVADAQASSTTPSVYGVPPPPPCPTPDYDTTSTNSSTPPPSLSITKKTPPPAPATKPKRNPTPSNPQPATKVIVDAINTKSEKMENASHVSGGKVPDSVEMQSLESFTLNNPVSPSPKPPSTYFGSGKNNNPLRNAGSTLNLTSTDTILKRNSTNNKSRPVSVTIGEYPSGAERRTPNRFDFLPPSSTDSSKVSPDAKSPITSQLHSELMHTLSRSNLRKHTDLQDGKESKNHQISPSAKPAIRDAAEKIANTFANNNRVTIKIPNGVGSTDGTVKTPTKGADNVSSSAKPTVGHLSGSTQPNGILKNGTGLTSPDSVKQPHRTVVQQKSITFGEMTVDDDLQNLFAFLDGLVCCLLLIVVCSAAMLQDVESAEEVNVSYCYGLDPSIENFELISVIPVECVNLSVFCRRKKRAIKAHFCNNVQWNLWCEQIKFLNPDHPGSSHSETSVASFSSSSTLYVVSSNLVKRSQGQPQLWQHYGMGAGDSSQVLDTLYCTCCELGWEIADSNKHSRKSNSSDNISLQAMVVNRFGSGVPENCLTGLLLKPKKSSLHLISCQQDLKLNNSSSFPMVYGFPMFYIEDNFPSCLYEQAEQALHLWEDSGTDKRGENRHPRRYGLAPQPFFLHGLGSWQTMPGDIYTTQRNPRPATAAKLHLPQVVNTHCRGPSYSWMQIKQAVSLASLRMCPTEPEMCLQVSHRQLASSVSCEALHLTPHFRYKISSRSTNKRLMQRRPVILFWTPGYSYRPTNTRSAYKDLRDHLKKVKLYQETNAKQRDRENGSYLHNRCQRDPAVIHLEKLLELDVKWTTWEFDSSTLAYQITMIDCDLFLRIPQSELRTVLLQKSSRNAPNLRALIAFSRRVCCLVATEILNEESHKKHTGRFAESIGLQAAPHVDSSSEEPRDEILVSFEPTNGCTNLIGQSKRPSALQVPPTSFHQKVIIYFQIGDVESGQQKKGHLDHFLELCQLFQEAPDVATKRLNEMTALLAKCQRAAAKYALNQNNLAKEFLLKARYREESDNFIFSFKLEPMYSSLKMKMVNSKLQIKSSFYFDEHLF